MASGFQVALLLSLTSGLFIAGTMSQAVEPVPACPPGWTQLRNRCFTFFRQAKTWAEAESACIRAGGNLASIHNAEENIFLSNLIYQVTGSSGLHTWIGGSDAVQEKKWFWSDGTPFNYQRWGPNEPNNWYTEHCIEMNWAGTFWGDSRCYYQRPYICSKDAQITPQ